MMRFEESFFESSSEGILLAIKVVPQSSVTKIDGVMQDADGAYALKLRVTAAPEDGKANKLVIKHLAKMLKIPATTVNIIAGETARKKTLHISGLSPELLAELSRLQSSSTN